jgi:hypothetical protein
VGGIIVVGGNIRGYTGTMTTTIALETSKGDLALALGLGLILILLSVSVTVISENVECAGEQIQRAFGLGRIPPTAEGNATMPCVGTPEFHSVWIFVVGHIAARHSRPRSVADQVIGWPQVPERPAWCPACGRKGRPLDRP